MRSTGIEAELARAARVVRGARQAARGAAAAHAHHLRPRDAARGRGRAPASRTTRATSTVAAPGETPYTLLDYFPDDFLVRARRVARHRPAAARPVRGRPVPQGHAGRARVPAAVGDGQPAAALRGVRREGQPGRLHVGHAEPVRARGVDPGRRADRAPDRPRSTPRSSSGPTKGQIDDLVAEIRAREPSTTSGCSSPRSPRRCPRTSPTTCSSSAIRVRYLHSEVDTLERVEILRSLRLGEFDVLVGINLLREGLDLPEVSLVAILDADKEGFLRSATSLIQMIGRAGAQRRRPGRDVRRPGHRLDAQGDLRDEPAAQAPARVQRRARHRPADDPQEGHRHPRDGPGCATADDTPASRGRGRGRRSAARSAPRCSTSPGCRPTSSAG